MSSAEWDMFYGAKHELIQYQMNPNGTKYEGFCKCLVGEKDLQKPCIIFGWIVTHAHGHLTINDDWEGQRSQDLSHIEHITAR